MPKPSRYNHFQRWSDEHYLAFNARSGAVALMTEDNYSDYLKIVEQLKSSGESTLSDDGKELLEQLKHGQFMCADDFDEIRSMQFQQNMVRYDTSALGLVIAPTLACNMACEYCYEPSKQDRMAASVVESIIKCVESQAEGIRHLDITWYGGEPLLAMDVIEDLTETFLDLAQEHKFEYTASMISNGYLLTKKNVDRLVELKVRTVQVTIDGPSRFHNKKRPLKNGQDSFETILGNIDYASSRIGIGVRVNVDQSFSTEIVAELLEELKARDMQRKVGIYFGQLEPSTSVCANIAESCYGAISFAGAETEYYRLLLENGFRVEKLPSPMAVFCMAQGVNGFVVDPKGNICRCWNYIGDEQRSMGHISDEIKYDHPNFIQLFDVNPFELAECRDCSVLPVCMGGCPDRRTSPDAGKDEMCESWKFNLEPMLETIAASCMRARQQAETEKEMQS
ncbi:MAG: radical SAM protein [candidate division Zixibacteria bacterium]|nr:radical SAM protein [candidate division Zixibacteria bacterium]MDH3937266.1 radical SAM protein [candidate division Zixibacteria bacterium]MDH4033199.1 radical SAM protein [candidate division Zixibacteria bacterium]